MDSKYKFDLVYLKNTARKLSQMLKNNKLSKFEKFNIKCDIMTLNDLISISENKTSLFECEISQNVSSIKKAKEDLFNKMIDEYNYFGDKLIKFIIELNDSKVLENDFIDDMIFDNNLDELVIKTSELYSSYSNKLYKQVIKMLSKDSILEVKNADFSSFRAYINYLKKCFFVIDSTYAPFSLSHEAFHGITAIRGINYHPFYEELGSILFETLYIDKLYDEKTIDSKKMYFIRIDNCLELLDDLADYFKLLLIFKDKYFMVSDKEFCETIRNNIPMYETKQALIDYLSYYALDTKTDDLTYIISFIKSLEIREKIKCDKRLGINSLFNTLHSNSFTINTNETFECTKRYIKEIHKKNN